MELDISLVSVIEIGIILRYRPRSCRLTNCGRPTTAVLLAAHVGNRVPFREVGLLDLKSCIALTFLLIAKASPVLDRGSGASFISRYSAQYRTDKTASHVKSKKNKERTEWRKKRNQRCSKGKKRVEGKHVHSGTEGRKLKRALAFKQLKDISRVALRRTRTG